MTTVLITGSVLAALAFVGGVIYPKYRATAWWCGVLALGQAASLGMIEAGRTLRYQHYATVPALAARAPLLLLIVLVQLVLVILGLLRLTSSPREQRVDAFPVWRMALAVALAQIAAVPLSADLKRYAADLGLAVFLQLLAAATVLLAVRSWPASGSNPLETTLTRLLGSDDESSAQGDRAFVWRAALLATVIAAALNVLAYERYPHIPDEVVYLHQAKYFAEGRLSLPAPVVPAAFDVDLMEYEPTRWYSPVPPGWPAVLAIGAWAHAPWLVNPLLSGLNVLLTFSLIRSLYGRRAARASAGLLAVSPWFLFLGMSFMTHQLTLTASLAAAVGIVRARESHGFLWGLLAGVGVGVTSLIRPLDGVIVGALIALWALGVGGARLRVTALAGLALGTFLIGALVFPYNRMLTGDPLKFPINAYADKHYAPNANAYGFGPDRGLGWAIDPNPGHSPTDAVINTNLNIAGINTDLFGWPTGSVLLIVWLACSGAWRRQDFVMAAVVVAFVAAYFPYYFSGGPDFGARYWYPVIVPLVALSVRGLQVLEREAGARVWVAVAAMSVMSVVSYLPWRGTDKYYQYRGMRADIRQLASQNSFADDLVLVRGNRFPDYASAFALNPVDLTAPVAIYAWDQDAQTRAQVLHEYSTRRVWLVDGPSVTGAGFRVAAGPIDARSLLAKTDQ